MKFGDVPLSEAVGAILAHSVKAGGLALKKGIVLSADKVDELAAAGVTKVTVARLEDGDIAEDDAAGRIAAALQADGLRVGPAFTGRANLIADRAGVITIDRNRIASHNAIDEGMTLATVPHFSRIAVDQLVATVKVIPYALPFDIVERGCATLGSGSIALHPFTGGTARLIMTRSPGIKESLLAKGEATVRARTEALGYDFAESAVVAHEVPALAGALEDTDADLTLILGASATSDRHDVAPEAVVAAGGVVERFGMPVDPGNLLFLAELKGRPVVGLPGCARSPALNGVDWVLERLAAGLEVTSDDIAAMGVGGLLKEMVGRPQPRRG